MGTFGCFLACTIFRTSFCWREVYISGAPNENQNRLNIALLKPNIKLGHNVIYVDTICLCGLHDWSSDSHQSNLSFKSQSFLSPKGSVRIKEHAFPRSFPLAFTITAITSLRKKIFSPAPHSTLPWVWRSFMRLSLSSFIGRISCPIFVENNVDYLVLLFWTNASVL